MVRGGEKRKAIERQCVDYKTISMTEAMTSNTMWGASPMRQVGGKVGEMLLIEREKSEKATNYQGDELYFGALFNAARA